MKSSPYGEQFQGMQVGSAEFNQKWQELAKTDKNFAQAQHDFVKASHYDKAMDRLKANGIDLSNRGRAVQEAVFSTSVQFGAGNGKTGASGVISAALAGKDVSQMSDAQIVSAIQDHKIANNERFFRSSSAQVRAATLKRAQDEKAALVSMANQEAKQGINLQGVSGATQQTFANAPAATQDFSKSMMPENNPALANAHAQANMDGVDLGNFIRVAEANSVTGKKQSALSNAFAQAEQDGVAIGDFLKTAQGVAQTQGEAGEMPASKFPAETVKTEQPMSFVPTAGAAEVPAAQTGAFVPPGAAESQPSSVMPQAGGFTAEPQAQPQQSVTLPQGPESFAQGAQQPPAEDPFLAGLSRTTRVVRAEPDMSAFQRSSGGSGEGFKGMPAAGSSVQSMMPGSASGRNDMQKSNGSSNGNRGRGSRRHRMRS